MKAEGDGLRCRGEHLLPYVNGYVQALANGQDPESRRTFESFGYEWTTFDTIRSEDEEFWAWYFQDVPREELRGRVGLDAGCGKGRYTRWTAQLLEAVVALDGSAAVEAAVRNLADNDNVLVVRGDLREAPLAESSLGFVCSLGVLHHLPDPRAGFLSLVRLLEPDGLLMLYLYSRPSGRGVRRLGLALASSFRKVTPLLPHRWLRALCAPLSLCLYLAIVVPGRAGAALGIRPLARLPLQTYRRRPVRSLWLDTFDRLSAPLEHRFVWSDLEPWFRDAGLDVLAVREDAGFHILARKPAAD